MRFVVIAMMLGASACEIGGDVDPGLPDDCVAGPAAIPTCPSKPLVLSSVTASTWLGFYACSGQNALPGLQADVDGARGNEGLLDAFFAVVDATWTFDGTASHCTDYSSTWMALGVIRALRDPYAFARLDALVWRPLPTPTFQLEADEYQAAEAIACIQTPEAQAEAQNIAATHPSRLVREVTASRIQSQNCSLGE
jgi:hypothetical protein